jgi:glutamyl-tRNA reductase
MTSQAIVCVGLSHKTAPIGIRERLAIGQSSLPEVLASLQRATPLREVAVLSTCNRVEIYGALGRETGADLRRAADDACRAVLGYLASHGGDIVREHLHARMGRDALVHLFRVASSLDSLVVGEPQILGQLKDAVDVARTRGTLGPLLGRAMHRALSVGKRVRSDTAIGEGQVSVSSVAIDLAVQIFGDLAGRKVLLVGAGEMAEAASKALAKRGAKLIVINRSRERAERLAVEVDGEPRDWGTLNWSLIEADIVVSSTSSPEPVITYEAVKTARKARRGRSLFLIDIAVPRDVEPSVNKLDDVYLYDVDDLSQIVSKSLAGRAAESNKAEAIVTAEADAFETWSVEQAMKPAIVGLRTRTKALLVGELERSLAGKLKHLPASDREALLAMVEAATNKLCHAPSTKLRSLASDPRGEDAIAHLRELFELPETDDAATMEPPAETPAPAPVVTTPRSVAPASLDEREGRAERI